MKPSRTPVLLSLLSLTLALPAAAKPLKVFILTGQSNMEGHAQTRTFPAIAKDPKTADLYKKMVDADGEPATIKDVSFQGFHYHGSAKFFARIGEAFADALLELK